MKIQSLILLIITQCVYPATIEDGLNNCLNESLQKNRFILGNTEKVNKAMFHWNTYLKDIIPSAVVQPISDKDVIEAVKCASQFNKTISVRSGGHSYEGYWMGNPGGVVIDLKNMNQIEVDKEKKLVKVEAGSLLGPLMAKLWIEDKGALPHGLQQVIGVGGHTLGGGYGLLSRKYGLLMDRVLEMEVITADSKKLIVNRETNPDLFFSLLGAGGGSYGVVTSFTYNYINPPAELKVARLKWEAGLNNFTSIFNSIMKYYESNPESGSTMYVNFGAAGRITMGATFSADTKEEQQAAYDQMLTYLIPPNKSDVRELDFINSFLFYSGLGGDPDSATLEELKETQPEQYQRYFKARSGYFLKAPPTEIVDKLGQILVKAKKVGFFLLIDLQGGKIAEIPNDATAFVHRNTLASAQIAATSEDGLKLMDDVYNLLEKYLPQAYQNYIDKDEKLWLKKYYGEATKKLILTKNKYDPNNIFSFERSIPLSLN